MGRPPSDLDEYGFGERLLGPGFLGCANIPTGVLKNPNQLQNVE